MIAAAPWAHGQLRWIAPPSAGKHHGVPYERSRAVEAAQRILDQRGWCVYEACVERSRQLWETRVLLFDLNAEAVADALEEEIELEPEHDGRLVGCDRHTLCPEPGIGAHLVYLAEHSPLGAAHLAG